MYAGESDYDPQRLYQGDVLDSFPFLIFEDGLKYLKRTDKHNQFEVIEDDTSSYMEGEALLAVGARLSRVMILSQTCDAQQRENVIIAPIYSLKILENEGLLSGGKIGLIRKRRVGYWFYLPEQPTLIEESLVDFQTIQYIPRELAEKHIENKILSLSDWGRHHLGWALSGYFSRPIEDKSI